MNLEDFLKWVQALQVKFAIFNNDLELKLFFVLLFSNFIRCGFGLAVFSEQMLVVRGDLSDSEDLLVFERGAILVR